MVAAIFAATIHVNAQEKKIRKNQVEHFYTSRYYFDEKQLSHSAFYIPTGISYSRVFKNNNSVSIKAELFHAYYRSVIESRKEKRIFERQTFFYSVDYNHCILKNGDNFLYVVGGILYRTGYELYTDKWWSSVHSTKGQYILSDLGTSFGLKFTHVLFKQIITSLGTSYSGMVYLHERNSKRNLPGPSKSMVNGTFALGYRF